MTQRTLVLPTDTIDADEWSIVTNRRQLIAAIRVWLGDIAPEMLHDLENGTNDLPGVTVDDLPGIVDELIDHIKGLV